MFKFENLAKWEGCWHALLGKPSCGVTWLVRAKSRPLWGGLCDRLGYESNCWVEFDFQFDITHNLHRCGRAKVWKKDICSKWGIRGGLYFDALSPQNRQDCEMGSGNLKWWGFELVGKSMVSFSHTCLGVKVSPRLGRFKRWDEC
jgi:hypothetical protein